MSLLHLIPTADWRAALSAGVLAPTHGEAFVHLSTPAQVQLPADAHYGGRRDVVLLAVDPAGLDVRFEPGRPQDPSGMRFPHVYGRLPTSAVVAVLPYRPGPAGFPPPPAAPDRADTAARAARFGTSVLRRVATDEVPVAGGVAVLTAPVRHSRLHNQLVLVALPESGGPDAATVAAEADRVLGGAGLPHRLARLAGPGAGAVVAGLAERGWSADRLVTMAAPAGGPPSGQVAQLDREALRPLWDELWLLERPDLAPAALADLTDRYRPEEAVVDLRYLAVRDGGSVVASALLKLDGATAELDVVNTHPAHRGRGHGDALVTEALALAGAAGCDLVVLDADADDWPRHWYARRGFAEVAHAWEVRRA